MGQLRNRRNSGLSAFSSASVMKSSEGACPKVSAHVGFPGRFSPRHHPADIYSLCCIKSEGDTVEGRQDKDTAGVSLLKTAEEKWNFKYSCPLVSIGYWFQGPADTKTHECSCPL